MALTHIHSPTLLDQEPVIPEPSSDSGEVVAHRLDFVKLGLPEYQRKFAWVIDNLFSPDDCARYVAKVESEKEWEQAGVGASVEAKMVDTSYRNSSRILFDSEELAREIFNKLEPYLKDIEYMDSSPLHRDKQSARLVGLNKRLRFLKYGPGKPTDYPCMRSYLTLDTGQFFNRHCDGTYSSSDGKQISYYTLQLYLNGSADDLQGGATRFWKMGNVDGPEKRKSRPGMPLRKFVDVAPRVGRALIFEQRGLVHSGEEVLSGTKITVRTDLMFGATME